MANLFDTDNVPTTEPATIVSGDLLQWKRTDLGTDYANGSYTLSYKARLEGTGSTVITITASASGDDFLVSVGQSTTASYTAGDYRWQAYITRNSDSERLTIDSGTFEVAANRSASTADPRSHAKTMLDKLESILEGRADGDVAAYSINGRSLTKLDITDLLMWRDRYRADYLREVHRERALNGTATGSTVVARF
ncbi:MAG: hypothetical protein VCE75_09015 [Alphaproteobacteria bacterium]